MTSGELKRTRAWQTELTIRPPLAPSGYLRVLNAGEQAALSSAADAVNADFFPRLVHALEASAGGLVWDHAGTLELVSEPDAPPEIGAIVTVTLDVESDRAVKELCAAFDPMEGQDDDEAYDMEAQVETAVVAYVTKHLHARRLHAVVSSRRAA